MVLGSKKATATTIGAAVIMIAAWLLPTLGVPADVTESAMTIIGVIVGAYNVGQGLADFGKEAVSKPIEVDIE